VKREGWMHNPEIEQTKAQGSSFRHKGRRRGAGVATTLSMLMVAATASAEVVATGDLESIVRDGALNGTNITWDNQMYQPGFFPWAVNLGAAAGINVMEVPPPPYFFGQALAPMGGLDNFEARFGNFFIQFYSDQGNPVFPPPLWNGVLSISTGFQLGEYICEAVDPNAPFPFNIPYVGPASCSKGSTGLPVDVTFVNAELNLAGSFVDNGVGTLPTGLGDGSTITYSIDGGGTCVEPFLGAGAFDCSGRINLNAFRGFATPVGTAVPVDVETSFSPPGGGTPVPVVGTVTYNEVLTDGLTTVVTSSQGGGTIPFNFSVDVGGWTTIYIDISTTANVLGPITVCGEYADDDNNGYVDDTAAHECDLRLLHNDGGGVFEDATLAADDVLCPFPQDQTTCDDPNIPGGKLCINTVENEICGSVDSLSLFLLAVETTLEGELLGTLQLAIDRVDDLDPTVFGQKRLQKAMSRVLTSAVRQVESGEYSEARDTALSALKRTDGCANDGEPDVNDWIQECEAQSQVYPLLEDAIALLDEILAG